MIADSRAGQARVPHAVKRLLLNALALRDRHAGLLSPDREDPDVIDGHAAEIDDGGEPIDTGSPKLLTRLAGVARLALGAGRDQQPATGADTDSQALAAGRAKLKARLEKLLAGSPTHDPNRRLLGHLANESENLLTFLDTPGVQATNWRAEQAIRPAVVNRKNWGGSRTPHGAEVQQVLMSVIRTARQQHADPIALLTDLQRHRTATVTGVLRLPAARDAPQGARGP
ncbi:MAG: transposase [Actinomycetota bacterium]|nr:transposase [Actinomycetota bacterium]